MPRRRKRLDPDRFDLPAERIRDGAFSDRSAVLAREVLLAAGREARVLVQCTADRSGIIAGTDETVALLKAGIADWSAVSVHALYDGEHIDAGDAVLTIEGNYAAFAHLEALCLGVLARRTLVATNARHLVEAARPKPVYAFPARHDHWSLQPGDLLAAQIGGALVLAADAPPPRGQPPLALMPHALIAAHGGDTVLAARTFAAHVGRMTEIIVPVDYDNDAVATSVAVAGALPGRLWGVRLATSEYLVDKSIIPQMGSFPPAGVNPNLIWNVRNALDAEGYGEVKLLVSGGVTAERIRQYEEDGVPADAYGAGAALFAGRCAFTSDVVMLNGRPQARAGSEHRANEKLEKVK
jgi:nicotinate phosphoribosyltransferase